MGRLNIKWIDGYKGRYAITRDGRVLSYRRMQWLRTPNTGRGYPAVELAGKTFQVHRLVAIAFVDNPRGLPVVNHLDEVKTNNHYTNLQWCTSAENTQYSCAREHHVLYNGEHLVIHNLAKYCRTHKLNQGNLNQVALGHKPYYKGYTPHDNGLRKTRSHSGRIR